MFVGIVIPLFRDTTSLQEIITHISAHILYDPAIDRSTEPCGLCGRPAPLCTIFLKKSSSGSAAAGSVGTVQFGPHSGYFSLNAEPEQRSRLRHMLNRERVLIFLDGFPKDKVQAS